MDHSFLAVPEHLGFCHILVTMNRVEVNTGVQMPPQNYNLNSIECSSELNSLFHEATPFSVFGNLRNPHNGCTSLHTFLRTATKGSFSMIPLNLSFKKKRVTTSYFRGDSSLWFPLTFLRWISEIWALSACLP